METTSFDLEEESSSSDFDDVLYENTPWSDGLIEVLSCPVVTVRNHHIEAICKYTKAL